MSFIRAFACGLFPCILLLSASSGAQETSGGAFDVPDLEPDEVEDPSFFEGGGVFGYGFGGDVDPKTAEAEKKRRKAEQAKAQAQRIADAREILQAEDIEQLLEAESYVSYAIDNLSSHIAALRKVGDREGERRLTEFYLRRYPVEPTTHSYRVESQNGYGFSLLPRDWFLDWSEIAVNYYSQSKDNSEAVRRTVASLDAFEEFRQLCQVKKPDIEVCVTKAKQFVQRHPQSEFCVAVVFNGCRIAQGPSGLGVTSPSKPIAGVCGDFVAQLERLEASPRTQLLVKALHAQTLISENAGIGGEEQKLHRGIALLRALAAESNYDHQQIAFLFQAIDGAKYLKDVKQQREIYRYVLDNFPRHPRRSQARLQYVNTFIDTDGLPAALAQIRALDEEGEEKLDPELFTIADCHFAKKEFGVAKSLCEEIITRFPDGPATGAAYVTLAQLHLRDGDEAKAVAAYRQAAEAKSFDTNYGIMDASNTKNEAHEFLGEHYMEQEDWQEALRWWEAWEPRSWCGNCLWSMQARRKEMIQKCQEELAVQPTP